MKQLNKTSTLVLALVFCIPFVSSSIKEQTHETKISAESSYCEGWEDGYCEGWKDVEGRYAVCPVTPVCPVPEVDCSQGYKCGYNRGFKRGMKDALED